MPNFLDTTPAINVPNLTSVNYAATLDAVWTAGFRLIRTPFDTKELDMTIINYAVTKGFKIVVDYHVDLTWWNKKANFSKLTHILGVWAKQVASISSDTLAIEVLNEPRMGSASDPLREKKRRLYDKTLDRAISVIRKVSPDRWIVCSGPWLGDIDFYNGVYLTWIPPTATRLIVALHYYRPYILTHPPHYLAGTTSTNPYPYPYPPSLTQNATYPLNPPMPNNVEGNFAVTDFGNLATHFSSFASWCTANGVYGVVGEFGCHDTVPDRLTYLQDVINAADANNLPVIPWAFGDEFGYKPSQADAVGVLSLFTTPGIGVPA